MPETIPLSTTLSVEGQDIIIDYAIRSTSLLDLMYERIPAITRGTRLIEWPVERDADAWDDFFRGICDDSRSQEIQHSQLVRRSKSTPCIAGWTAVIQRERWERRMRGDRIWVGSVGGLLWRHGTQLFQVPRVDLRQPQEKDLLQSFFAEALRLPATGLLIELTSAMKRSLWA